MLYFKLFLCNLCLLISFLLSSIALSDENKSKEELIHVKKAIAEIEQWMTTAKTSRSKIETDLRTVELQASALTKKISQSNKLLKKQKNTLSSLQLQKTKLLQEKDQQAQYIRQYIRAAYITGQQEYIKLILNQEDIAQAARMLKYYEYFSKARIEQIENYKLTLNALQKTERSIQIATKNLEHEHQQLAQQQIALNETQVSRQEILKALLTRINNKDKQLQKLRQDRKILENLLRKITRTIVNIPLGKADFDFVQLKGRLLWPTQGHLLNSFGAKYKQGNLHWQGVRINAKQGSAVGAIHHGRVVFADWLRGQGLLIIVDHGDGYMSLYAHNQALYKDTGDWVSAGETISLAGKTGGLQEPSVYFEIRYNGQPLDPILWCNSRKKS